MNMNLWGYLTIATVFGVSFAMLVIYLDNKKKMKQLEIEALQIKAEKSEYK